MKQIINPNLTIYTGRLVLGHGNLILFMFLINQILDTTYEKQTKR